MSSGVMILSVQERSDRCLFYVTVQEFVVFQNLVYWHAGNFYAISRRMLCHAGCMMYCSCVWLFILVSETYIIFVSLMTGMYD
jgi:hypothetical protein